MRSLFLLLLTACLGISQLTAQTAYRSKASGNWNDILTWEKWDGNAWINPVTVSDYPDASDSVYLQSGHTVTLTQSHSCLHLNINNAPGVKLNLNDFNLLVSGKIALFTGIASLPVLYTNINLGSAINNGPDNDGFIRIVGNNRVLFKSSEWATNFLGLNLQIVLIDNNQLVSAEADVTVGRLVLLSGDLSVGGNLYMDNGTTGGDILIGAATLLSVGKSIMRNTLAGPVDSILVRGTLVLNTVTAGNSLLAATLVVAPDGILEMKNTESIIFNVPDYVLSIASKLIYSGNIIDQPVGDEFPRNGIRNLVVNTTGSINLNTGKNIADTLIMLNGNINVPLGDSVSLGIGANAVLIHTAGTIVGKLNRYIPALSADVKLFPVGTDDHYRPITVDFAGASLVSGSISIEHTDGSGGVTIDPITDGGVTIDRRSNMFWDVNLNSGLLAANIKLQAGLDGQSGIGDSTLLRLIGSRNNGLSLGLLGATSIPILGNLLGLVNLDLDSNLRLYLGGDININPLPVKLVSFTAKRSGDASLLSWLTASEINNSHFEIERSHDGRSFENIGVVKGALNSSKPAAYSFTDNKPLNGLNLYRLAQVDKDGRTSYSEIAAIDYGKTNAKLAFGPNPVNDNLTIISAGVVFTSIEVYDITGQRRLIQNVNKLNDIRLNMSELVKGVYMVRCINEDKTVETIRIQKL